MRFSLLRPQLRRLGEGQICILERIAVHRRAIVRVRRLRTLENVGGHHIIVRCPPASDFHPDVVAAARGDHGEMLVPKLCLRRHLVLNGAELVERLLGFSGQQLLDDARDCLERQHAGGEFHLPGRCNHVRLFADMDHEGVAVEPDDGLEQRGNETHLSK